MSCPEIPHRVRHSLDPRYQKIVLQKRVNISLFKQSKQKEIQSAGNRRDIRNFREFRLSDLENFQNRNMCGPFAVRASRIQCQGVPSHPLSRDESA